MINRLIEELKTLFFLAVMGVVALVFVVKDIIKRIVSHDNDNPPGPPAFT